MSGDAALPIDPPQPGVLPDITAALAWRDWETGLAEAVRRRVPILALAEAPWTNSAQRVGLVLGQDAALRALLEEAFVPVLVDPFARPDLAGRWRAASIALAGTIGPPLMVLLTHEGEPFLSYCTMWPEGRAPHPSLAALARATSEAYARDPDAFLAEARALDAALAGGEPPAFRSAADLWRIVSGETDPVYGGMRESPKHPHPQFLWLLLDLHEAGEAADAGAFVQKTLRAMLRGGINDQIGEGFHRCSRDERWIVPHFEKPVPLNAQLACVYARAARVCGDEDLLTAADALATFCLEQARQGIDAVASDSRFFTWTARELLDALSPSLVQAVSLHFNTTPDGSRQVLYRARELETLREYSPEAPETLRQRLADGRRQLHTARAQRPPPDPMRLGVLSWPAQTLLWLFRAAGHGRHVSVAELAGRLDALTAERFRDDVGYARPDGVGYGWLEDQAAILGAMLAAHRATGEARWLERARPLADVLLDRYGSDGGWLDRAGGEGTPALSRAVRDDVLPSPIAMVTAALAELGALVGEHRYVERARTGAATHLPAGDSGPWAAALWRAWFGVA